MCFVSYKKDLMKHALIVKLKKKNSTPETSEENTPETLYALFPNNKKREEGISFIFCLIAKITPDVCLQR